MADIKQYTDQIAAAVYGEEVRSSIINALNKVNDDNNSYQDIKNEVVAAQAKVEEAQNTLTTLNSANSTASTNISRLESDDQKYTPEEGTDYAAEATVHIQSITEEREVSS